MNDPYANVRGRLEGVVDKGDDRLEAQCPSHDDHRASLSLTRGDDGRALVHCHAGCRPEAILKEIGLTMVDLFPSNGNGHATNGHAKRKSSKPLGTFDRAYDYHDEQGRLLFQVVRYRDPKDFRQRRQAENGNWTWKVRGTRSALYRLPQLVAAPDEVAFLCEGEKDADALADRGLVATTNPGGATAGGTKFRTEHVELLRGRHVVILPDADDVGRDHARHVAARLAGIAASVKVLELPGLQTKGDVSDWLANGGTADELRRLADECAEFDASGTKPTIIVGFDEERMGDQAIAALAKLPRDEDGIYQRGRRLVRITKSPPKARGVERPKGAAGIEPMPTASLREKIAAAATFVKRNADGDLTPVSVPASVVAAVECRGHWPGIAALEAVAEAPFLRSDGTVAESAGFDESTGVSLMLGDERFPPVPASPTRDEAVAARDRLLDLVCDFPFVSEASRAAWLAMTLTPFARFAYAGNTPFALVNANQAGCGKGLLIDVAATVWARQGIARMSQPKDDGEAEKRITALVLAAELAVNVDNIRDPLGGAALEAAMTAGLWQGRMLGKSEMTGPMPNLLAWSGTGNNVVLAGDMPRRVYEIGLEVVVENAEEREGFRHPNLLDHVRRHRGELAAACCTILRAYVVAGKPDQELPAWGSFEEWSRLVRSAVVWVGMADPAATRIELRSRADSEADALRALLAGWQELDASGKGLSVADAIALMDGEPDKYRAARQAFAETFGHKPNSPASTRAIGKRLSGFRRRVLGGKRFDYQEGHAGIKRWFVEDVR